MITRRSVGVTALFAILWATLSSNPAGAQNAPWTPPIHPSVDANNVNLVSGQTTLTMTDVSIGKPGAGGLTFTKYYASGIGYWQVSNEYYGYVGGGDNGTTSTYSVFIGGYQEAFTGPDGSPLVSEQGTGATLSLQAGSFVYTTHDGTVYVFSTTVTTVNRIIANAWLTQITLPNGETRTLNYVTASCTANTCLPTNTVTRLQSVTNNLGYQIKLLYQNNSTPVSTGSWWALGGVMGINMAVDYCDPLASSCTNMTQSWPSVTYDFSHGCSPGVTDQLNNVTCFGFVNSNTLTVTYPGNQSANIEWVEDQGGRTTQVIRNGQTWNYSYVYTTNPMTTTVTDPVGDSSTYSFDATTNVMTSYLNNTTQETTSYPNNDSYGRPMTIALPSGQSLTYQYDGRGNITETDLVPSGGGTHLVWKASFNTTCSNPKTCNHPNTTTDPAGNVTNYTWDPNTGYVTTVSSPAPTAGAVRPVMNYYYTAKTAYFKNASGSIVPAGSNVYYLNTTYTCRTTSGCASTSPDYLKTTISYGSTGVANNLLPSSTTTQDGAGTVVETQNFTYDPFGNLTGVTGPMAFQSTAMSYDAIGRLIGKVGPSLDGSGTYVGVRTSYDARGFPSHVDIGTLPGQSVSAWQSFNALQTIVRTFDAEGRVTQTSQQAGGATYAVQQVTYDAAGRVECSATRMNPATFGGLPASACTAAQAGNYGPDRIISYGYDGADRVTSVSSGDSQTPDSTTITTQVYYYPGGALNYVVDGNGFKTTYTDDLYGRLQSTCYPDPAHVGQSSTTDCELLTYDADSNVNSLQRRSGAVIGTPRDALGRIAEVIRPDNAQEDVFYSYDNQGRLLSALFGSATGTGIQQTYDGLGRLQTRTVFGRELQYGYDLANRVTRLTYPDGIYVNYNYTNEELQTIVDSTGTTLATYSSYDTLGMPTKVSWPNGAITTYTPDALERLGQLTQDLSGTSYDTTASFTYNPAGQVVTKTQTNDAAYTWLPSPPDATISSPVDDQNNLSAFKGVSVAHDTNRNVTSGITSLTYGYDALGQLRTATSSSGTINVDFDPSGMLRREINGGTETDYLYDGGNLIAEYVNGTMTARFVHGPGADQPLVWYQGSGTGAKTYLHADERGSIIAASNASGVATGSVQYGSYGESGNLVSPFGYTGQLYLTDLQLYYYKARMYSPQTGRFLQPDPSGYTASINLYGYAGGDPVNFTDPTGLCPTTAPDGTPYPDDGSPCPSIIVTPPLPICDSACVAAEIRQMQNQLLQNLLNSLLNQPIPPPQLSAPQTAPCTKYSRQAAFAKANLAAATHIANQLNTLPQNILGLAGYESNWGTGPLIAAGTNNYFSLKVGPAFATGATGTWLSPIGNNYYTYSGFIASGNAFARSPYGALVAGIVRSPEDFAAAVNSGSSKYNSENPHYDPTLVSAINQAAAVMGCH